MVGGRLHRYKKLPAQVMEAAPSDAAERRASRELQQARWGSSREGTEPSPQEEVEAPKEQTKEEQTKEQTKEEQTVSS